MLANIGPVNLNSHPTMTLSRGATSDGQAVGMMLVGRHFDELTLYRATYAFERAPHT